MLLKANPPVVGGKRGEKMHTGAAAESAFSWYLLIMLLGSSSLDFFRNRNIVASGFSSVVMIPVVTEPLADEQRELVLMY